MVPVSERRSLLCFGSSQVRASECHHRDRSRLSSRSLVSLNLSGCVRRVARITDVRFTCCAFDDPDKLMHRTSKIEGSD